jgi:electron transfer flavoprotein alpha subunit
METVATEADTGCLTSRTRSGCFIKGDPRSIKITDADRIVAGGRGAGVAGFETLRGFADLLGAAMAGSRIAVDDGHIPFERQIGISGNTVAPKLLVTGGISGAREFTVGMEDADLVIAINTDPKARIFGFANLCINGDVNRVIPAVMRKLEAS